MMLIVVLIAVAVAGAEGVRSMMRRQLMQPTPVRRLVDEREPVVAGAVDVD